MLRFSVQIRKGPFFIHIPFFKELKMKRNLRSEKREQDRKTAKKYQKCSDPVCEYCAGARLFKRLKEDTFSLEEIGKKPQHLKNKFRKGPKSVNFFFWHKPEKKEEIKPLFLPRKSYNREIIEKRAQNFIHELKNLQVLTQFGLRTIEAEYRVFSRCRDFMVSYQRIADQEAKLPEQILQTPEIVEVLFKVREFEEFWANKWDELARISKLGRRE